MRGPGVSLLDQLGTMGWVQCHVWTRKSGEEARLSTIRQCEGHASEEGVFEEQACQESAWRLWGEWGSC